MAYYIGEECWPYLNLADIPILIIDDENDLVVDGFQFSFEEIEDK